MLGYQSVTITVEQPPTQAPKPKKTHWDEDEMVELARQMIVKELTGLLQRDIMERVVGPDLRRLVADERSKGTLGSAAVEQKPLERRGLKGLSFKKQRKIVEEEVKSAVEPELDIVEKAEDEDEDIERPMKRRKKEVQTKSRKVLPEDLESEEEDESDLVVRKRATSEDREEDEEPLVKKPRQDAESETEVENTVKKSLKMKKSKKKRKIRDVDAVIFPDSLDFDAPAVVQVDFDTSLSPSRSSSPAQVVKRVAVREPTPPLDPIELGLCDDDEDIYFTKLTLSGYKPLVEEESDVPTQPIDAPSFRRHVTGSARTEGFYKVSHAEKAAYVSQYQARSTNVEVAVPVEEPQHQVTSSRSNRASARRRAQGLEEMNQVQRAVALSKGEAAAELSFKFNQLQTRKKQLRFARSPIHDWGLYAMERIAKNEMVIEYVGEVIRAQVADKREKAYERQGIGSSYLFRIDEDLVVDATKKGNLGYASFIAVIRILSLILS